MALSSRIRCSRSVGHWRRIKCRPAGWRSSYATPGFVPGGSLSGSASRSEEHTSELQSRFDLVCRLLLEKKKKTVDQSLNFYCPSDLPIPLSLAVSTHLSTARAPRHT